MTTPNKVIKNISVFGGSWPKSDHEAYQEAFNLGRLLANAGYTVLNGGYIGTMEAVSRGASESGGYVVGFPCDEIENWRGVKPNQWLNEELRYPSLRTRLMAMIDKCDAAIALSGGVGTLAEISMMWNHLLIESIPRKPLILIGNNWKIVVSSFLDTMDNYIHRNHRNYLHVTDNINEAIKILHEYSLPMK